MKHFLKRYWLPGLIILAGALVLAKQMFTTFKMSSPSVTGTIKQTDDWVAPDLLTDEQLNAEQRRQIEYGKSIIANTAKFFGPSGTLGHTTNGMNCQNCHLDAGTRPWGNNYSAVASTYPKFRERSGSIESIPKRINDCFERSLNGKALPVEAPEMKAIIAYMKWLGKNVNKGEKPKGVGIPDVAYLPRAADTLQGRLVYSTICQSCHGAEGEGIANLEGNGYTYPPVWGKHSYNTGAGLYRLSRFAGYVKDNMPFGQATHSNPLLTDEQAWDVAAFINSQPRPTADISGDWPNISAKPIDHPFGPYSDGFTETQHKYGPFKPIQEKRKQLQQNAQGKALAGR